MPDDRQPRLPRGTLAPLLTAPESALSVHSLRTFPNLRRFEERGLWSDHRLRLGLAMAIDVGGGRWWDFRWLRRAVSRFPPSLEGGQ